MYIKKVKLINHDCLHILVLLYIMLYVVLAYLMLYIVLAYLMLFAALSNAVCFYNGFFILLLIFANAFCFMLCLGLKTQFVYFKYDLSSCTVPLICSFLLILCSHHCCFLQRNGYALSGEKHFKITIIVIKLTLKQSELHSI